MTPVGRALFAAFRRLDVSTSLISGNPSFQTDVGSLPELSGMLHG